MTISAVIGVLAALIGSTATLLAAWAYIRSEHPPKRELFRAVLAVTIIMASIVVLALVISRATITFNGQQIIPLPVSPAPTSPIGPALTPTPTSTSTPTSTPTPILTPTPTPVLTPTPPSTPTSVPTP